MTAHLHPEDAERAEAEAEYAAMLSRVTSVRKMVATGINIQGAPEAASRVAEGAYRSLLEYIDWLELAIAISKDQHTGAAARPLGDWHEDDGDAVWWTWRNGEWRGEPAHIGSPISSDWPGYHTHWTPHPKFPSVPAGAG